MVGSAFTFRIFVSLRRIGNCDGKVSKGFWSAQHGSRYSGAMQCNQRLMQSGSKQCSKIDSYEDKSFYFSQKFLKDWNYEQNPYPSVWTMHFFWSRLSFPKKHVCICKKYSFDTCWSRIVIWVVFLGPSNGVTAIVARTQHNTYMYMYIHLFIHTFICT